MDIKENLIRIRESKNLSKRTVSEQTGIPYTTYIKYESGERKDVSMDALCKLADFYGVTTDYLLGREPAPDPFEEMRVDPNDEQAVLDRYMSFPPQTRAILLDALRQLAGEVSQPETELVEETTVGAELDRRAAADAEAEETAG